MQEQTLTTSSDDDLDDLELDIVRHKVFSITVFQAVRRTTTIPCRDLSRLASQSQYWMTSCLERISRVML